MGAPSWGSPQCPLLQICGLLHQTASLKLTLQNAQMHLSCDAWSIWNEPPVNQTKMVEENYQHGLQGGLFLNTRGVLWIVVTSTVDSHDENLDPWCETSSRHCISHDLPDHHAPTS